MNRPNWKSNKYKVDGMDWNMTAYFEDLEEYCNKLEEKIKTLNEQLDLASYDVAFYSRTLEQRNEFYKIYRKEIRKKKYSHENYVKLKECLKNE